MYIPIEKMKNCNEITILGGGPAGMAIAYYANARGIPFTLFEASERIGGNCITMERNGFFFDSGAHRLHDKDIQTTEAIKQLMGDELELIQVPSQIYRNGRFIDFPLSPFNLLKYLGIFRFSRAAIQILFNRVDSRNTFRDLAAGTYGEMISRLFLLHYTEKLWGLPAERLSPAVAGKRLKGLNLKSFILETLKGSKAKTAHLDGQFHYPKYGIGSIFEKMKTHCGSDNFRLDSRITGIFHHENRITEIEVNGAIRTEVNQLVSTLPLGTLFRILRPRPPAAIMKLARSIRFRNVLLVCFFLNKANVNDNGSMYFPSEEYPFTRIYEPRNRSRAMAPPGKTSLIVEIPCQETDNIWNRDKEQTIEEIESHLIRAGFFTKDEILGADTCRIFNAYPVLEAGFEQKIEPLFKYLSGFENLYLSGRNGLFAYTHIHDHMKNGRNIVRRISNTLSQSDMTALIPVSL
ncbi:MAG: FAD-dependent oxidoreductase [Candidatus Brocadiaceae bacterium]|nr:FAD-dependent oxidoreductase [Candidatus Brocadiaceae bacterium]